MSGGKGGGKSSFYSAYGAIKKAGLLGEGHIPEECVVFVRGIPPDTSDGDLYRLFTPFGALAPNGVRAMTNPDGSCKGFGFANFADPACAAYAVQTLDNFQMPDGKVLQA